MIYGYRLVSIQRYVMFVKVLLSNHFKPYNITKNFNINGFKELLLKNPKEVMKHILLGLTLFLSVMTTTKASLEQCDDLIGVYSNSDFTSPIAITKSEQNGNITVFYRNMFFSTIPNGIPNGTINGIKNEILSVSCMEGKLLMRAPEGIEMEYSIDFEIVGNQLRVSGVEEGVVTTSQRLRSSGGAITNTSGDILGKVESYDSGTLKSKSEKYTRNFNDMYIKH